MYMPDIVYLTPLSINELTPYIIIAEQQYKYKIFSQLLITSTVI